MRPEITEIQRAISTICSKPTHYGRTWTSGTRTSRADSGVAPTLTHATVDAVFETEAIEIAPSTLTDGTLRADQSQVVARLSEQLALLESQCTHLRQMLQMSEAAPAR